MAKNPIENSWEKYGRLSEGHLHQLLYGTDKSKGKTAFERFYEKHAEQIKRQNGWSDVSQDRVRLWLQQQRSQLTEADALLTLERTFESDRDRRIAQTSERVRGDVAGVLGETVEGVSDWEQELASANKAEILSGEEELTSARLEAFRIGIREQIGRLDITERRQEHMTAFDLFEFYAKVLGLEVEDESGMAFRMAFVKRYRDFRDKDFLQGHFRAIAEDLKLGAGSMAAIQQRIASFLNESKKLQSSDIHTLLNENFPQLSVSREEVDTMLADRELKKLPNGMMAANSWILTNFLTELETAKLRRSCLVSDGEAASTERQISAAESQIAAVIKGSRVHHETSDRLISDIPDDVADKVIKVRLRNAVGARTVMMGSKTDALDQDERLKSELKSMKIKAGGAGKMRVRAFLDEAQAQAYSHLLRVHRISGDQVRTFRDLDPAHFDIFDMVLNPDLYLGRLPQPGVEDQDPAAKAEQERTLSDIRGHIDQLEKLVQAGMRVGGSWDKAACDLEIAEIDLLRKNYSVWADREPKEPKYHYRAVERDGERQKDFRVSQEKVSLELPLDLLRKYDNLTRDKRKLDQYSRTIDFFDTAGGFDNPLVLNQALELFYSDYNRLSGRHLSQSAELRKVMMVDHPLTAVMFNAATRQPRSKVGGGMYLHRQDGQPVTFKQRAGKLMEKARDFLRTRNFHGLKQLFEDGQEGERLYLDSAFFPRGNFASEDNTMRILSEARKDPAFDRLLLGSKGDEVEKMTAELAKDFSGKSNSLADDPQFVEAFSDYSSDPVEMDRRIADKRQEWLDYYEARYGHDEAGGCELGSRPDPKFSESALAAAAAAGAGGEEIDQELIKKLASEDETLLLAKRVSQLGGGAGYAATYAQKFARAGYRYGALVPQTVKVLVQNQFKDTTFCTPMSLYKAIQETITKVSELADFRTEYGAYDLLANIFDGTIVGSEFKKAKQNKENERVNKFKESFDQWGHQEVLDRLKTARDKFELKAVFISACQERGLITSEDILDPAVIKQLNKHTPTKRIPTNYSVEDMHNKLEIRVLMLQKIREAIDEIWGDGQYQQWMNANTSKYEQTKNAGKEDMKNNPSPEKLAIYSRWWRMLQGKEGGIEALKKIHPGDIVGHIEEDMLIGRRNSGETWGLMQAMICQGIVKKQHLARILTEHANDLPVYCLMEPEQAKLSGLTAAYERARDNKADFDEDTNDFLGFFYGRNTLELELEWKDGKWEAPRSREQKDGAIKRKKMRTVDATASQLQQIREPQIENLRKWDNCCSNLGAHYSLDQFTDAFNPDVNGNIQARPHDLVGGYRGMHNNFSSQMIRLLDNTQPLSQNRFDMVCYEAYAFIAKTCGYAGFLARYQGRGNKNFETNRDGSPMFGIDPGPDITKCKSGMPNFQSKIVVGEGPTARMPESAQIMDNIRMTDRLRKAFKNMAGYQYLPSLGVNPDTGKTDQKYSIPYDKMGYDPMELYKETMAAFIEQMRMIVADRNASNADAGANGGQPLRLGIIDNTGLKDFEAGTVAWDSGQNFERVKSLQQWKNGVYGPEVESKSAPASE